MERREAMLVLEDTLHHLSWTAEKAEYLLEDVIQDFFCYSEEALPEAALEDFRGKYARACAKTEIAKDLVCEVHRGVEQVLDA